MSNEKTVSLVTRPKVVSLSSPSLVRPLRRVAGYARVSTDKDEQFSSYEAQIDYYTKLIQSRRDWVFLKVYTDEGISGTSIRFRHGFLEMIDDALDGKIDLIVTKSISRFARNTVDSLTTIRRLKEAGCEVYFEKENIYTFDSKGELLITIMSSLAQEESRSLSENVTWGTRKRFADGKYHLRYKTFLGYRKGADGSPEIVLEEACIVRRIYWMFLEGMSLYSISKVLTNEKIPTPSGRETWYYNVIRNILTNEKYKGDALLQKTYSTSFLTKHRERNNGEVPQYYVRNGHPAIVDEDLFRRIQELIDEERSTRFRESDRKYSKRFQCSNCGNWYTETVWHPGTPYEKRLWQCNRRNRKHSCSMPCFTTEELEKIWDCAKKQVSYRQELLTDAMQTFLTPVERIDACRSEIEEIRTYLSFAPKCPAKKRIRELQQKIEQTERLNFFLETGNKNGWQDKQLLSAKKMRFPEKVLDYLAIHRDGSVSVFLVNGVSFSLSEFQKGTTVPNESESGPCVSENLTDS